MDMFEQKSEELKFKEAPLATRMRPATFGDFVGQEHLIGKGHVLRKAIETGKLQNELTCSLNNVIKYSYSDCALKENQRHLGQQNVRNRGKLEPLLKTN